MVIQDCIRAKLLNYWWKKNNIDEAIYVGDTQGDFEACEMANIPMIFASYGFGKVENPAYTINDIKELPSLMAKINTK